MNTVLTNRTGIFSCDKATLKEGASVRPSVRPSVRQSITLSTNDRASGLFFGKIVRSYKYMGG